MTNFSGTFYKPEPDPSLNFKGTACKLYNCKYMITSTQITNTESFTFIAV